MTIFQPIAQLRAAKQSLITAGPVVFHHGFGWDEPVLTPEWLRGVGVADLSAGRCRVLESVMADSTVRQIGAGRPRNPLRRLARRAIAAINAPQEFLFEPDRVVVRGGPDEPWEDYSHALLDDSRRRLNGDPLWPLEMLDAPESAVQATGHPTRCRIDLTSIEGRLPAIVVEGSDWDDDPSCLVDLQWDGPERLTQFAHLGSGKDQQLWQVLRFVEWGVEFGQPDLWQMHRREKTP